MLGIGKKRRTILSRGDWYHDSSPEDRREYDAFGPWILEVHSEAEMPPRFRPRWPSCQGARFLLKVPQNVDRRDARPGQALYRALLAVFDDRICFLTGEGEEIAETVVPVGQIAAIGLSHCLLLGEFQLLLASGETVEFSYNTVSRALLVAVVDDLRTRLNPAAEPSSDSKELVSVKDFYFLHLAEEHRRRNPLSRVRFCDEPGKPCTDDRGRRRLSPGLLILDSGTERTLIALGTGVLKRGVDRYGHRCFHVPQVGAPTYSVRDGLRPQAAKTLELEVAGHSMEFPFFGETPRILCPVPESAVPL